WWAIRSREDHVLDPSFGGGVFLCSASKRLHRLGGQPANQVFCVEIDPAVHTRISNDLVHEFGIKEQNLFLSDFFDVDCAAIPQVDAIVGNPPFIRYQRFSGNTRRQALKRAAEQGVKLSELSSSWAPFLIHCAALLKLGGRIAMVIPVEIGHAAYGRP